jgi:hypothetical protein
MVAISERCLQDEVVDHSRELLPKPTLVESNQELVASAYWKDPGRIASWGSAPAAAHRCALIRSKAPEALVVRKVSGVRSDLPSSARGEVVQTTRCAPHAGSPRVRI